MDDMQARHPARDRRLADVGAGCSLGQAELEARLEEIRRLTGWALEDRTDDAEGTVLVFDRDAASQVRDLVERERECCGHLEFGIEETDAVVRLTIRARSEPSHD